MWKRDCKKLHKVLTMGATLVTFVLGISYLDHRSIWLDEAHSVHFARMDWLQFWKKLALVEANGGLYYTLLKFWILLGDDEFTVRLLSVIFATAAIPVFFAVAKTLFDRRVGVISSFLLGVNGFFIFYSQEARAYSLLVLLTICSTYFFIKCILHPSRKTWAGYVVCAVLSVYSHFFAFWIILVHIVSLAFLPRDKIDWKRIIFLELLYSHVYSH